MASEQFSLCWDNFHKNMSSGMNSLLENEDLVDVTLAVEGKYLKAHKMVLSVCSPYFKELFKSNPCQHPIVFMKDVSYVAISDLLQFMYQGEVQVSQDNLTTFIKTAEALQIKGLTGDGNGSTDADSEPVVEKPSTRHVEETYKPSPRPKKQLPAPVVTTTPAPKRPRLSVSSNDSQSTPAPITKTEPVSTPVSGGDSAPVQFKVEPYDQNQSVTIPDDTGDDNFGDDTLDDNMVDDTEDYSMMEGEEPQAGTSTDGTGEGQDFVSSDSDSNFMQYTQPEVLLETANVEVKDAVPTKSGIIYQAAYQKFIKWCQEKNLDIYCESTLLAYFTEMATKVNMKSSTMWSQYSMIKSLMNIKHGIDISKYLTLRAYLKKQNEGYTPKETRVFTKQQFDKFIFEALDEKYLAMKLVLIIGISGACRCEEMVKMKIDDIEDMGNLLHIKIPDSQTHKKRSFVVVGENFINIFRKYASLRPEGINDRRFFLKYTNGKCHRLVMGKHSIGNVPREVASYLKLSDWEEYTGHCFRRTSATLLADGGVHAACL